MPGAMLSRAIITSRWEKLLKPGVWSMTVQEWRQEFGEFSQLDNLRSSLMLKGKSLGLELWDYTVTYPHDDEPRIFWEFVPRHESSVRIENEAAQ
jgi:hypothetical protein